MRAISMSVGLLRRRLHAGKSNPCKLSSYDGLRNFNYIGEQLLSHSAVSRGFPTDGPMSHKSRRPAPKEAEMSDLRDAVSKCLASAKRLLDETAVSGISLPVVVDDKDGKYEAVAESYAELTSKFLLCAWATLRAVNPEATPDALAQAAFAIARQVEKPSQPPTTVELSSDPTAGWRM